MSPTRFLTTLLLTIMCLFSACGGAETDVADEPVDVADTTEQTEDAVRPGGGLGGFSSCSAPTVHCYDDKGRYVGTAAGCERLCYNQTAQCWPGACSGRVVINASCGCSPF